MKWFTFQSLEISQVCPVFQNTKKNTKVETFIDNNTKQAVFFSEIRVHRKILKPQRSLSQQVWQQSVFFWN